MSMKLADEIRQKYAIPHYTFEDVTNEIRRFVFFSLRECGQISLLFMARIQRPFF